MAYTVDRVISEVLYKRLENEFKTLIVDMLEELQTKKPVEKSNTPVKINAMLENIESIFSDQAVKVENKVSKSKFEHLLLFISNNWILHIVFIKSKGYITIYYSI